MPGERVDVLHMVFGKCYKSKMGGYWIIFVAIYNGHVWGLEANTEGKMEMPPQLAAYKISAIEWENV